jgi:hypothetical protein
MLARVSVFLLAIVTTGASLACSCVPQEQGLARMEAEGFLGRGDVFHAKVSHWTSSKEVDVQIIEAFAGTGGTKHLVGEPGPGEICGGQFSPGEEFIYLPSRGNVIGYCSKWRATPATLSRLRAIAQRPSR